MDGQLFNPQAEKEAISAVRGAAPEAQPLTRTRTREHTRTRTHKCSYTGTHAHTHTHTHTHTQSGGKGRPKCFSSAYVILLKACLQLMQEHSAVVCGMSRVVSSLADIFTSYRRRQHPVQLLALEHNTLPSSERVWQHGKRAKGVLPGLNELWDCDPRAFKREQRLQLIGAVRDGPRAYPGGQ